MEARDESAAQEKAITRTTATANTPPRKKQRQKP
jgi:hypothetical protein